ncbi:MAG: hypothetical protein ACRDK1_07215 [Solirubrobacterales bacterium]
MGFGATDAAGGFGAFTTGGVGGGGALGAEFAGGVGELGVCTCGTAARAAPAAVLTAAPTVPVDTGFAGVALAAFVTVPVDGTAAEAFAKESANRAALAAATATNGRRIKG